MNGLKPSNNNNNNNNNNNLIKKYENIFSNRIL